MIIYVLVFVGGVVYGILVSTFINIIQSSPKFNLLPKWSQFICNFWCILWPWLLLVTIISLCFGKKDTTNG